MASIFLTTMFDDENSLIMIVYSGFKDFQMETLVDTMTDEELSNLSKKRRELRINFPGLASMNFELLLEILMEEVVGWDMSKNCATDHMGAFGKPYAVSFAVEEQGQMTLHGHMTIWITGFKKLQNDFFFKDGIAKQNAARILCRYHDHITSTKFFPERKDEILKAFNHDCTVPNLRSRRIPVVVHDQSLRNLRNKQGYKDSQGHFATCPDCFKNGPTKT